ncbi:hypothetical protein TNCV_972011 [Trichonephila clavipes]|nr:hypothetical protein TNCV_972011 [Trichonephila clavipes]
MELRKTRKDRARERGRRRRHSIKCQACERVDSNAPTATDAMMMGLNGLSPFHESSHQLSGHVRRANLMFMCLPTEWTGQVRQF